MQRKGSINNRQSHTKSRSLMKGSVKRWKEGKVKMIIRIIEREGRWL